MILIYDMSDPTIKYPLQLDGNKAYREHKYDGLDLLQFEIQRSHEMYKNIAEEVTVEGFENRFIVKQIDEHSDFVTVKCKLDLDEWKQVIKKNYRPTNSTIEQVLNQLIPSGWTIDYGTGVDTTKRTTVEEYEGRPFRAAVPYDIMPKVSTAFGMVFNYDVINKKLSVINPDSYEASGEFFSEDVNMKSIGFNGSTEGFATRLYPYGKSDEDTGEYLTIASVNDGKEYVEDNSYSSKIVSICWVDERYTDPASLKADAEAKLKAVAEPLRSYTCDVLNFDEDFWLYKVVTIIDVNREQRIDHQVVSYREYEDHSNDVVTLSQRPPDISNTVIGLSTAVADLDVSQVFMQQYILSELQAASDMITGSKGGSFRWIYDNQNRPRELVNLGDTDDINTAQKVWRWNAGGLGHSNTGYNGTYDLALTADGKINASMITAGILNANIIRAGVIQDLTGNNWWNLETGQMHFTDLNIEVSQVDDLVPENLLSIFKSSEKTKLNSDGTTSSNNYFSTSDYIDVVAGEKYTFQQWTAGTSHAGYPHIAVAWYNSSKVFILYQDISQYQQKLERTLIAPTNSAYLRLDFYHDCNTKVEHGDTGTAWSRCPEDLAGLDDIIAKINMSPEQIVINAQKINLTGYATFAGLSDGTTTIDGGCLKTGTIDASLVTVTNLTATNIVAGILKSSDSNLEFNIAQNYLSIISFDKLTRLRIENGTNGRVLSLYARDSENENFTEKGYIANYFGGMVRMPVIEAQSIQLFETGLVHGAILGATDGYTYLNVDQLQGHRVKWQWITVGNTNYYVLVADDV